MDSVEQINLLKNFFLISAILNILFGIGWVIYTVVFGMLTCGIMCLFGIFPVVNIVACVMDFAAYNKLNSQNQTGTFSSVQFASVFDIVTILTGNIASMVFGIIGLVFINSSEFKAYLTEKGIY